MYVYGPLECLICFATFNGLLLADVDTFIVVRLQINQEKELDGINIHSTSTTSTSTSYLYLYLTIIN